MDIKGTTHEMKQILVTLLASVTLALSLTPSVQADALMTIAVGGTIIACDTSQIFSTTNCSTGAGFVTIANGNGIGFIGTVNGVSFGNAVAQTAGIQLSSKINRELRAPVLFTLTMSQ